MADPPPTRLHATCCAAPGNGDGDRAGVLLTGPSGSGKSDLALRLVDAGFLLVADDLVAVAAQGGAVIAWPGARSTGAMEAGLIEVRGLGLIRLAVTAARARVALVVALTPAAAQERLPAPASVTLAGIAVPSVMIDPAAASAVARIRLALAVLGGQAASHAGALGDAPAPLSPPRQAT
jgi:serine kinase of HPr protein (carbohydrate metabolism regulator)